MVLIADPSQQVSRRPSASVRAIIRASRADPSIFTEWVLGKLAARIHDRFHDHLSKHNEAMVLMPRGHGKTTQLVGRIAWEIGRDPNIRIRLLGQNAEEPQHTVELVSEILESPKFEAVFPDVRPDLRVWSKKRIRVTRDRRGRDPTLAASSIFGRASSRCDLLIGDDVCDLRNSILSPALRDRVKEAWRTTWLPTLDPSEGAAPRVWMTATPYHVSDLVAEERVEHEDDGTLLCLPCREFESPWPEVFTQEFMRRRRRKLGPIAYARSYELRPVSSDVLIFDPKWLDHSTYLSIPKWSKNNGQMVAALDFAFGEDELDPSDPDYSVCLIAWIDRRGHVFIVDAMRIRATFPEFRRQVAQMIARYKVELVIAEAVGGQKGLVQQLREELACAIVSPKREADKPIRAAGVQAQVEQGKLHLLINEDGTLVRRQRWLYDEMIAFPAADHDDGVDCVVDMLRRARRPDDRRDLPTRIVRPSRIVARIGRDADLPSSVRRMAA